VIGLLRLSRNAQWVGLYSYIIDILFILDLLMVLHGKECILCILTIMGLVGAATAAASAAVL
jgi:hypothetical protein